MLDKMRGVLAPSLETLGRVFAKTGLSPNVWTAIGLILSLAAAVSYTSSEWIQGIQAWHAITVGDSLCAGSTSRSYGFFDISCSMARIKWHDATQKAIQKLEDF